MTLTNTQRDWMRHSISTSAALVNMNPAARNALYTPQQQAMQGWLFEAKRAAYNDLKAGVTIEPGLQPVANYLLDYADAHNDLFGVDDDLFRQVMSEARHSLHTTHTKGEAA